MVRFWNLTASAWQSAAMRTSSSARCEVAVVIDATFGDDEAGLPVANQSTTDSNRARVHHVVQPPSTMRFAPVM